MCQAKEGHTPFSKSIVHPSLVVFTWSCDVYCTRSSLNAYICSMLFGGFCQFLVIGLVDNLL